MKENVKISMITKIKITITIAEKKKDRNKNNGGNTAALVTIKTQTNKKRENSNFEMEVVSIIKETEILKYTCFHVIPCICSPLIGFFPHMSMSTMTRFPVGSVLSKRKMG